MSAEEITRFHKVLSDNQCRITRARDVTFMLLLHPEPQSMAELIRKSHGKIDRVSVYRCIELFEKLGIAHRVYVGWKYKLELSDEFVAHHHHLVCVKCGRIIDIEDEKHINDFIETVSQTFHFTPHHHRFEIEGYCSSCSRATLK